MDWDVFWSVLVVMFIIIPLLMIWGFAIVDLFWRSDLSGFGKVMWLLGILIFPFFGTLFYYITRPAVVVPRGQAPDAVANTLSQLKSLHDSGDLSDSDYEMQRSRLLMAH